MAGGGRRAVAARPARRSHHRTHTMTDAEHERLFALAEAVLEVMPDGISIDEVVMVLMLAAGTVLCQLHDDDERAVGLEISIEHLRKASANPRLGMH